jgi:hypothetical protein
MEMGKILQGVCFKMVFKMMRRTFWYVSHFKKLFGAKYIVKDFLFPFTFLGGPFKSEVQQRI